MCVCINISWSNIIYFYNDNYHAYKVAELSSISTSWILHNWDVTCRDVTIVNIFSHKKWYSHYTELIHVHYFVMWTEDNQEYNSSEMIMCKKSILKILAQMLCHGVMAWWGYAFLQLGCFCMDMVIITKIRNHCVVSVKALSMTVLKQCIIVYNYKPQIIEYGTIKSMSVKLHLLSSF